MRDEHGQPLFPFPANLINNYGKATDQLIGIAQGIMCDGELNDAEAAMFRRFVEAFDRNLGGFPFDMLKKRLDRIFEDGVVDDLEREELKAIMRSLGGMDPQSLDDDVDTLSSTLPLDTPAPPIELGTEFVVTGRFALGTRARVEETIHELGGLTNKTPRQSTRYLVIGHFASRDWIHTSYGRKIERAVELRNGGSGIAIISEQHWKDFLKIA